MDKICHEETTYIGTCIIRGKGKIKVTVHKEKFEQYRSKREELGELEYKINNSENCESMKKNFEQLKRECDEIEKYIESISDSQLRRIFRMRYIDGKSLFTIGNKVHLDKSNVSRKINYFFKSQRIQQTQHYNEN